MAPEIAETTGPAGPGVELHFTPEPDDYVQAVRTLLRRDVRAWITLGLVGLVVVVSSVNLVASGRPTLANLLLLLLPLGLATYLWQGWPLLVGRRARRDRRLRSPTTCRVSDERFVTRDGSGEALLEWPALRRVLETKTHYLLVFAVNRRTFCFIPRRAFTSAAQEALFRDIVQRHLPGGRKQFSFVGPHHQR